MDFKIASKDRQILQYVCENFSCKICNNILIQCVTLSCGHHVCNYCLDLLYTGMSHQCPQCSSPIHQAEPNNSIDQQIDKLINSCSPSIQQSYASAINSRFQKSLERNKARQNNERRLYSDRNDCDNKPKLPDCLDQIRHTLKMNDINPSHSVTRSLKSARNHHHKRQAPNDLIPERSVSSNKPRSKPLTIGSAKNHAATKPSCENQNSSEIDVNKVNMLFGIYDHVLSSDTNEPNKNLAAGDFVRDQDLESQEIPMLESMNNFTKRSELELESLIKETDNIIRIDDHIHKWTNKMKDALAGNTESGGIADENFDKQVHIVDDELWKASNELLLKLQGMQKQRKLAGKSSRVSFSCPPTPLPRSYKLNFDVVSNDSDVEEYEQALENLQECLDNSYDLSIQTQTQDDEVKQEERLYRDCGNYQKTLVDSESTKISPQKHLDGHADDVSNATKSCSSGGVRSARRKSFSDLMEESGQTYIKENIEFITQMRKYKEALMKIQNREVVTAQEISKLVPTPPRQFPLPPNQPEITTTLKCGDVATPRRLSHINQGSSRNHSYSARLPMSSSLDRRPLTATATYDLPSSRLIHKQIAVGPGKQYLKQRSRANNPLFTAR